LILTNDGALTQAVTRAGRVPKVYHAKVKGHPGPEQIARLRRGVTIEDRRTAPADVDLIEATGSDNVWYRIVLREGRNQQIRKMFDAIGHSVVKLRRTQIGPIDDANLPVGMWRYLTEVEVKRLMSGRAPGLPPRTPVRGGKPGGPTRRKEGPQGARGGRTSRSGRDKKGRV